MEQYNLPAGFADCGEDPDTWFGYENPDAWFGCEEDPDNWFGQHHDLPYRPAQPEIGAPYASSVAPASLLSEPDPTESPFRLETGQPSHFPYGSHHLQPFSSPWPPNAGTLKQGIQNPNQQHQVPNPQPPTPDPPAAHTQTTFKHSNNNSLLAPSPAIQPTSPSPPPAHTSTIYPPYASLPPTHTFPTSAAAALYRATLAPLTTPPRPPSSPTLLAARANPQRWIARLYAALTDAAGAQDNAGTAAWRRFVGGAQARQPHYEVRAVVAGCWRVLDAVVAGCGEGFRRVGGREVERRVGRERGGGGEMTCAERLEGVCEALRREKTVCVDVLEKGEREVGGLVGAPAAYVAMKRDYRRQNDGRGRKARGEKRGREEEEEVERPAKRRKVKAAEVPTTSQHHDDGHVLTRGPERPLPHARDHGSAASTEHEVRYVRPSCSLGQTSGGKRRRGQRPVGAGEQREADDDDMAASRAAEMAIQQNPHQRNPHQHNPHQLFDEPFDARQHGPLSPRPPPPLRYSDRLATGSRGGGSCASVAPGHAGRGGDDRTDSVGGPAARDTDTAPPFDDDDAYVYSSYAVPPSPRTHAFLASIPEQSAVDPSLVAAGLEACGEAREEEHQRSRNPALGATTAVGPVSEALFGGNSSPSSSSSPARHGWRASPSATLHASIDTCADLAAPPPWVPGRSVAGPGYRAPGDLLSASGAAAVAGVGRVGSGMAEGAVGAPPVLVGEPRGQSSRRWEQQQAHPALWTERGSVAGGRASSATASGARVLHPPPAHRLQNSP
ncbi:uncharacterized protein K452DRAFT_307275 [Neofusicoccum parvum]|uniref:Uncharacterized protein K452DRAFT_307275 n=1 Tax=Neofusicoccum parvum TaxID=310453 RepID=A0ACB5S424_9PEZI|nr:uncharacterized protein K452DRAFT_307275 [Neofusicoccum parvum]